jgi:hypothetical protein
MFKFRIIYVAGATQNFAQAIANLSALRRVHPPDRHEIEVLDGCRALKRALAKGLMASTLIKLAPSLTRRIVGISSQAQPVAQALGLETVAA